MASADSHASSYHQSKSRDSVIEAAEKLTTALQTTASTEEQKLLVKNALIEFADEIIDQVEYKIHKNKHNIKSF